MKYNDELIIGLNCFGHDNAAALLDKMGNVLYASSEERHSNIKFDSHFPIGSIEQCLKISSNLGCKISKICVNFNYNQFLSSNIKFELLKLLNNENLVNSILLKLDEILIYGDFLIKNSYSNSMVMVSNLLINLNINKNINDKIINLLTWYFNWAIKYKNISYVIKEYFKNIEVSFFDHHLCHAASAYFYSGFSECCVIIIDGQGESVTTSIYNAENGKINLIKSTPWPNSIGILYLNATIHLGFKFGDEFKVMGMAAYGTPKYLDKLRKIYQKNSECIFNFVENDDFKIINLPNYTHLTFDYKSLFSTILPPNNNKDLFNQEHFDFAASIQALIEEIGIDIAIEAIKLTGKKNLALAGGVCLNGLMNNKILNNSGCDNMFIFPASGDDGTAVGAACLGLENLTPQKLTNCFWGSDSHDEEILSAIAKYKLNYTFSDKIHRDIANLLIKNNIVARFNGKAEFGPRALGNRSILANPTNAEMKDNINIRIKHREKFRPFAPACLKEHANQYFFINDESPFMLQICKAKVKAINEIPAVIHEDKTARVQTVDANNNSDLHKIISSFHELEGPPVILNTSFNINGETIVNNPLDAIESFLFMNIDALAIGNYLIMKSDNQNKLNVDNNNDYLKIRKDRFKKNYPSLLKEIDISAFHNFFRVN